jgi:pantothenate kinase
MTGPGITGVERLARTVVDRVGLGRSVIAIVGAPGSGKSTLAERLEADLNALNPGSAAVLSMDGYHFDDDVLVARGLRARRGAPETFDVGGLLHMLGRLQRNEEDEIAVPVFDRTLEISRAGARLTPRTVQHLIVEGNYLLLATAPWSGLRAHFDITVSVVAPEDVLRRRLTARWRGYGLSPEEIAGKVEANDLPNGRFVIANSVPAAFVLDN